MPFVSLDLTNRVTLEQRRAADYAEAVAYLVDFGFSYDISDLDEISLRLLIRGAGKVGKYKNSQRNAAIQKAKLESKSGVEYHTVKSNVIEDPEAEFERLMEDEIDPED